MMKKYLLGTAAAVACLGFASGALAEGGKINLELGGYYVGMAAFTDNAFEDPSNAYIPFSEERSYKFGSDSEVHVKGDMTLDNGLVVGFQAQFELEDDQNADSVDEVSIYLKGGWGKLEFGQQDGVGDHFRVNSTRALVRLSANDSNQEMLNLANITTVNETSTDFTKITYMTPSFSGLKLGLSFTPEAERNSSGFTSAMEDTGDEIVEFGGIYQRKMDDVDFAMSATYVTADDSALTYDLKEWNIGAKVGVAGFTFGGSYRDSEGFAVRGMANSSVGWVPGSEYTAYEAGVSYETGPWLVAVQYASHEADDMSGVRIVEGTTTFVAARYQVTTGFQVGAGIQFSENEMADEDGSAFVIETALKF